VALNPA